MRRWRWPCFLAAALVLAVLPPPCGGVPTMPRVPGCETRCETICQGRAPSIPAPRPKMKIAILIAGLLNRYFPLPTLRHLVGPAARAGHQVDYFASLTVAANDKLNGTDFGAYWLRPRPNTRFWNFTSRDVQRYISSHARYFGAHRSVVILRDRDYVVGRPPLRRKMGIGRPRSLRVALRYKSTEILWNWMQDNGFTGYDLVFLVREDVYFVDDVDPSRFAGEPWAVYGPPFSSMCTTIDKKNAGIPSDRVLIFGGEAAKSMLNLHTEAYRNPSPTLDNLASPEIFMSKLAALKGMPLTIVPWTWLPYFAVVHMEMQEYRKGVLCFRGLTSKAYNRPQGPCVSPEVLLRAALAEPDSLAVKDGPPGTRFIPFCYDYKLL